MDSSFAIIDFSRTAIDRCLENASEPCRPGACGRDDCPEADPLTHIKRGSMFTGSSIVEEIRNLSDGVPALGSYKVNDNSFWREMSPEWCRSYPECLRDEPHVYVVETVVGVEGYGDRVVIVWQRDVYVDTWSSRGRLL